MHVYAYIYIYAFVVVDCVRMSIFNKMRHNVVTVHFTLVTVPFFH